MASLTVTPLRRSLRWNALISVRRMIGVTTFAAVLLHLVLYAGQEAWDFWKVGSEIVLRIYLTIGFAALLGLAALAATSTDGMVRRLGRSEEHTSELQSLMRISYAVFCLKKKHTKKKHRPKL